MVFAVVGKDVNALRLAPGVKDRVVVNEVDFIVGVDGKPRVYQAEVDRITELAAPGAVASASAATAGVVAGELTVGEKLAPEAAIDQGLQVLDVGSVHVGVDAAYRSVEMERQGRGTQFCVSGSHASRAPVIGPVPEEPRRGRRPADFEGRATI